MILLSGIPFSWLATVALGFGLIIGSFLNVYIYRFHTGKSLQGNSHCLSCATPLRWFELFPVLSYLALRGRCRTCGCRIPSRYAVVELTTGLLFMGAFTMANTLPELLLLWLISSVLVVITVYDLYHFIIPDGLTIALTMAVVGLRGYQVWEVPSEADALPMMVLAAVGGAGFYLFLWRVSRGTWLGFGDVKLAFPLGLLVGPTFVFSFVVLSFWIGAVVSVAILLWQRYGGGQRTLQIRTTQLTMKSAVPFAPFLVASALTVWYAKFNVLSLFTW